MNYYNIYCDESSVDNKENEFIVIGAVFVKDEYKNEIRMKLKEVKRKYSYHKELKWNNATNKTLPLYEEVFNIFLSYSSDIISFHCIKVDKKKVNYELYHNNDLEVGFFKFYYQLLKNKFKSNTVYKIFLDYKPTKDKCVVKILEVFWEKKISSLQNSSIKKVLFLDSSKNVFIQLADLFSGSVNYVANSYMDKPDSSIAKKELVKCISEKIGKKSLDFSSLPSESKFNIFHIKLD